MTWILIQFTGSTSADPTPILSWDFFFFSFLKWCNKSESFLILLPLDISTQMGWLTSTKESAERALPHWKTRYSLQVCLKQVFFVLLHGISGLEERGLMHQSNWRPLPSVSWEVKGQMTHLGTNLLSYPQTRSQHTHTQYAEVKHWRPFNLVLSLTTAQRRKAFIKNRGIWNDFELG